MMDEISKLEKRLLNLEDEVHSLIIKNRKQSDIIKFILLHFRFRNTSEWEELHRLLTDKGETDGTERN